MLTKPVLVLCQKATFRLKNINFARACETYARDGVERKYYIRLRKRVPPSQNIFVFPNLPLFRTEATYLSLRALYYE